MTKRFARLYQKIRDRVGGRRKLALTIVAIWIAVELLAAATVAIAGKNWLESREAPEKAERGSALGLGVGASRSAPSIAVF